MIKIIKLCLRNSDNFNAAVMFHERQVCVEERGWDRHCGKLAAGRGLLRINTVTSSV